MSVQIILARGGKEDPHVLPLWLEINSGVAVAEIYTWNSGMIYEETALVLDLKTPDNKTRYKGYYTPKSQADADKHIDRWTIYCGYWCRAVESGNLDNFAPPKGLHKIEGGA